MRGTRLGLLAVATSLVLARGSIAGQVFVQVNSNFFQNTSVATLTAGDHVIWHWAASGHTVTSGNPNTGVKSGLFDSNTLGGTRNANTFFSWKTTGTSPVSYFCQPHRPPMQGSIVFPVALTQEAELRITEVRFDGAGSNFVEIANLGDADGDLASFRLVINGAVTTLGAQLLLSGQRATFLNPAGLTNAGSVALYAPHTITSNCIPTQSLNEASMMIDYVEWGAAGGQALESVAASTTAPNLWTATDFAPQAASGHSIVFCGTRFQHGRAFWDESRNPTQGAANDCINPVNPVTWGRIKTLYR
jgi:plastocyanin